MQCQFHLLSVVHLNFHESHELFHACTFFLVNLPEMYALVMILQKTFMHTCVMLKVRAPLMENGISVCFWSYVVQDKEWPVAVLDQPVIWFTLYWGYRHKFMAQPFSCIPWAVLLLLPVYLHVLHSYHIATLFTRLYSESSWTPNPHAQQDLQSYISSHDTYTECSTTLGHNCRRWFPRFLWSKKFI